MVGFLWFLDRIGQGRLASSCIAAWVCLRASSFCRSGIFMVMGHDGNAVLVFVPGLAWLFVWLAADV